MTGRYFLYNFASEIKTKTKNNRRQEHEKDRFDFHDVADDRSKFRS